MYTNIGSFLHFRTQNCHFYAIFTISSKIFKNSKKQNTNVVFLEYKKCDPEYRKAPPFGRATFIFIRTPLTWNEFW